MDPETLRRMLTILVVSATINMTLLVALAIIVFRMSMQLERIETTTGQTNRMLAAWATTWGQDPALVQKSLLSAMTGATDGPVT